MQEYLQETEHFDYSSETVQNIINSLELEGLDEIEKAKKLFYFVRDNYRYSIKHISLDPNIFKASYTLKQKASFCIPKAIALSTLARAVGIPARIHLVDFANHRLAPGLVELWGTNIMVTHCYSELFLNEKWVKATPALDIKTCEKHEFIPVNFDGVEDGLLKEVDQKGRPHAEYVKDHGTFADLPYDFIVNEWKQMYDSNSSSTLKNMFSTKIETFQ